MKNYCVSWGCHGFQSLGSFDFSSVPMLRAYNLRGLSIHTLQTWQTSSKPRCGYCNLLLLRSNKSFWIFVSPGNWHQKHAGCWCLVETSCSRNIVTSACKTCFGRGWHVVQNFISAFSLGPGLKWILQVKQLCIGSSYGNPSFSYHNYCLRWCPYLLPCVQPACWAFCSWCGTFCSWRGTFCGLHGPWT